MQLYYKVIFTNSRIQLNTFITFGVIMQTKKAQNKTKQNKKTPLDNFLP